MIRFFKNTGRRLSVMAAIIFLFFTTCKHKTDFNGLTEVSYSADVKPIISSNCAFSGCHGDSAYSKISLTSYAGLMNGGIKAGSPEKSNLYSTLKTLDEDDFMPKKPYNELTEKQIQLIYVWIGQGAKNN